MLCVNNYQCLPSVWSAFIQCYHKVIYQAHEKYLRQTGSRSNMKHADGGNHVTTTPATSIEVLPSYIDRMIPVITLLNEEYQIKKSNKGHCLSSKPLSNHSRILQPKTLFYSQIRTFRTKRHISKDDSAPKSNLFSEKEISAHVDVMAKSLQLGPREAMSFRLGMQEGLMLETQDKKAKLPSWLVYAPLVLVIAVVYIGYKIISQASDRPDAVSMNKRNFQAEIPDVSFDDVKGIDEVKQELQDVVQYLRDPDSFTSLGGKLPKGMLLVGPPGTGKTLLARAIAGEAGVPFYYASGSEFDEMFVGVGSARVRNLFEDARANAPCIIFIDEIDACGNKRTSSPLQPYARQTINQLLQEMDGFDGREGIIVLGATNMAEVLDKALTRPGRFDSEINVLAPDIKGRKEILELYVKKITHGDDLELEKLACLTVGMTGAALANLVNQAALRAGQLQKSFADMSDFEYALDKLRLGPELRSRVPTEAEMELTAFHEAGHALIAFFTPNTMPIYKATIRQRGQALGHVSQVPTREDESGSTCAKMLAQIDVLMGGRVAEEMLRGVDHVTTGASSDLQNATKIAFEFVCSYGMSEGLGFVAYNYEKASPQTKRKIEMEVNKLLENSYKKAKNLLGLHSQQHKLLAKALIKYETLSLDEIKLLMSTQSLKSVEKLRSAEHVSASLNKIQCKADGIPSPI